MKFTVNILFLTQCFHFHAVFCQLYSTPVSLMSTTPVVSGILGYGFFPNGSPILDWNNQTINDPGNQVPLAQPPGRPVIPLWTPSPAAEGQSQYVDTYPYDGTADLEYQEFSSITYYQLNLFMKAYNQIITNAADAGGVPLEDGPKVFIKQAMYTLGVYFPEILGVFRLTSVEDFWTNDLVDDVFIDVSQQFHNQFIALYQNNTARVIRIADEVGYIHFNLNQLNSGSLLTTQMFLNLADAQVEAGEFFLGSDFNDEVKSALESVFTFLNALSWHYQDLYQTGCLKRLSETNFITYSQVNA